MKRVVYVIVGIVVGIVCAYGTVCFMKGYDALGALAMGFAVVIVSIVFLLSSPAGLNLGNELNKIPCELDEAPESGDFVPVDGDIIALVCEKGIRVRKNDKVYKEFLFDKILGLNIADESAIVCVGGKKTRHLYEFRVGAKLKRKLFYNSLISHVDDSHIKYE